MYGALHNASMTCSPIFLLLNGFDRSFSRDLFRYKPGNVALHSFLEVLFALRLAASSEANRWADAADQPAIVLASQRGVPGCSHAGAVRTRWLVVSKSRG